jgi:DNA-binding MarR family transcriptional regulator
MIPLPHAQPEAALDDLAMTLVQQASLLTRLVFRHAVAGMSRSEASLLAALRGGPQRITALAEYEGLAQPTVTLLVKRLEKRGWVRRERALADGRAVLVSLTDEGRSAVDELRERFRPLLRGSLAALPDEQVSALEQATEAMASLVNELQKESTR